jgi:putative polyhydroxyalkanoate system protein
MSVIRLSRRHLLDQAAQEAALERLAAHLGDALGASVAREAQTIQFDGKGFSGTVALDDECVVGEVRLGLMMRPLKGVITREIEAGLDHYLAD